jgi:hypothetical protein
MKITTNTPRRLMLDQTPWLLGYGAIIALLAMLWITWRLYLAEDWIKMLVVGACAVIAPGALFLVVTREQLVLDRDTDEAIHRQRNLLQGYRKRRLPLSALREVQIRFILSQSDHSWNEKSYRAVLRFEVEGTDEFVPFPGDWGLEADALVVKRTIDSWIAQPRPPG